MEPDSLNAEGLYQHESVERLAFTDRLRLNLIDPVPDKAERESIKVLEMEPDLLDTEDGRQHDASVTQASCKLNGELNGIKLELRIGEPIQSMSTDLFRYLCPLAIKGKPDKVAFRDVRLLFSGGSGDPRWMPEGICGSSRAQRARRAPRKGATAHHRRLGTGHRAGGRLHRDLGRRDQGTPGSHLGLRQERLAGHSAVQAGTRRARGLAAADSTAKKGLGWAKIRLSKLYVPSLQRPRRGTS